MIRRVDPLLPKNLFYYYILKTGTSEEHLNTLRYEIKQGVVPRRDVVAEIEGITAILLGEGKEKFIELMTRAEQMRFEPDEEFLPHYKAYLWSAVNPTPDELMDARTKRTLGSLI